jgi:hypothetical protein
LLDDKIPNDGVFILRNAFNNPGILLRDFSESHSDVIHLLEECNSYLIITNQNHVDLPVEIPQIRCGDFTLNERKEIIEKHINSGFFTLRRKFTENLLDEKIIAKLANVLKTPNEISAFILAIAREERVPGNIDLYLADKAKEISKSNISLDNWFGSLDDLGKYFAITVALFPDLQLQDLLKRFKADNEILQIKKTNFGFPLDLNLEQYLGKANCKISDWGTIEFTDPRISSFVSEQLRRNYFFHFWELARSYSEETKSHPLPKDIEVRLAYARALGELGKSDIEELDLILREWGKSKYSSVRAATGYALKQICTDPNLVGEVERVIIEWMQDSSSDMQWTSIAASERLYSDIPETVLHILNQLFGDWRTTRATIHALMSLSRIDLPRIVLLLVDWISGDGARQSLHRKIAVRVSSELLLRLNPDNVARRKVILPLVQSLLVLQEGTCIKTMGLMKTWLIRSIDTSCQDDIGKLIGELISSDSMTSETTIQVLASNWLGGESTKVRELARSILDLYKIINDPVSDWTAITILDATEQDGSIRNNMKRIYGEIRRQLHGYVRARSFNLGSCIPFHEDELSVMTDDIALPNEYNPPRLIGPILDAIDDNKVCLVIIITAGEIVDLADYSNSSWTDKLVIYPLVEDLSRCQTLTYLSREAPSQDVEELIKSRCI